MPFPKTEARTIRTLSLEAFREMDYYAVNNYHLPVELMMESAGIQLARLTASVIPPPAKILVAVGPGNNGGGGLVAARRLEAWGYTVHMQLPRTIPEHHTMIRDQLTRTISYGVEKEFDSEYDLILDCLFGFSQRLPLPDEVNQLIEKLNKMDAVRISLDIPSGICDKEDHPRFRAHKVLTVAAPKTILLNHIDEYELYVADVGIPTEVYIRNKIDVMNLGFHRDQVIQLI